MLSHIFTLETILSLQFTVKTILSYNIEFTVYSLLQTVTRRIG